MPLTGHCSDSSDKYLCVYLHASAPGPPLLLSYHHPYCSSCSDDHPVPVRSQRCQPRLPVHGPSRCDLQVLATYQSSHINIRRRAYGQQRYVSACNCPPPTRCHKHPTEGAVHCGVARERQDKAESLRTRGTPYLAQLSHPPSPPTLSKWWASRRSLSTAHRRAPLGCSVLTPPARTYVVPAVRTVNSPSLLPSKQSPRRRQTFTLWQCPAYRALLMRPSMPLCARHGCGRERYVHRLS